MLSLRGRNSVLRMLPSELSSLTELHFVLDLVVLLVIPVSALAGRGDEPLGDEDLLYSQLLALLQLNPSIS